MNFMLRITLAILMAMVLMGAGFDSNDIDGDGVKDTIDNCNLLYNHKQVDVTWDGSGNLCDADFDGNDIVGFTDFGLFGAALAAGSFDLEFDLTDPVTGPVGFQDFGIFGALFNTVPSSFSPLPCAGSPKAFDGSVPCHVQSLDYDGDTAVMDNCIGYRNGMEQEDNPIYCNLSEAPTVCVGDQIDSDNDGYGDACDQDLDGDGDVDSDDYDEFIDAFLRYLVPPISVKEGDGRFDFNSDDIIDNETDLFMFERVRNGPWPHPGPSDYVTGCVEQPDESLICP